MDQPHSSNRRRPQPAASLQRLLGRVSRLMFTPSRARSLATGAPRLAVVRVCTFALSAVLLASAAFAQGGSIAGTVVDSSNAPVSGANVELAGPTGRQVTQSGARGTYSFPNVAAGTYELNVTLVGFAQQRRGNIVVSNARVDVPAITLALGSVSDTVVITASRAETALVDAPATMSVIGEDVLATSPGRNYADVLRSVPGVNVIQLSARDMNLTSRQATYTLANSELVLVDGRSLYLDFFGMVLWDFLPTNLNDVKQIEVVRGPASAVWGANALTGVVNVITKSPRENPGVDVAMSGGFFSRDAGSTAGKGPGGLFSSNVTLSQIMNDRWAYRVSAGYFTSQAYPRPTGTIPLIPDPRAKGLTVGGASYPIDGNGPTGTAFSNRGTSQPKFDMRFDQELANGGRLTYQGGVAATQGIIHTGLGPFNMQSGSYMSYLKSNYERQGLHINAFANFVNAKAPNLLLTDPSTGKPLQLDFNTKTFDIDARDVVPVGDRQVISFGGNLRRNMFDLTVAPTAKNRTEVGGYLENTVLFEHALLTAGARVDKFGNLDRGVFSPRLSVTLKPTADHAIRASFNRAFRSPSVINNYLSTSILQPVDLSGLAPLLPDAAKPLVANPFPLAVQAVGSKLPINGKAQPSLTEEKLTAYEIAYTGTINDRTTLGASFYVNDFDGNVSFTPVAPNVDPYTASNPPPGWQLPSSVLTSMAGLGIYLPRTAFNYSNLGPIRQKGLELSLDHRLNASTTLFANYSFQADPTLLDSPTPYPSEELLLPPKNRFNAGFNYDGLKYIGAASVNYSGTAFWSDVLTSPYAGYTDAYALVNASAGMKLKGDKFVALIKATNLLNQDIQQHVFGDILKRAISFEIRIHQ